MYKFPKLKYPWGGRGRVGKLVCQKPATRKMGKLWKEQI